MTSTVQRSSYGVEDGLRTATKLTRKLGSATTRQLSTNTTGIYNRATYMYIKHFIKVILFFVVGLIIILVVLALHL